MWERRGLPAAVRVHKLAIVKGKVSDQWENSSNDKLLLNDGSEVQETVT